LLSLPHGHEVAIPSWPGGEPLEPTAPAKGEKVLDLAPATGAPLAVVEEANEGLVDRAVAAAEMAQPSWNDLGLRGRAEALQALAAALLEIEAPLGRLEAIDTGSPIGAMRADASKGADYLRQCAVVAIEARGDTIPASDSGWHLTFPHPWGVVGAITAYNHPVLFACQKAGPALIMGNSLILKPSEHAPLSSCVFGALAADLFPPGVVNVVVGGPETAIALVKHPSVPRLTFTGGVSSGLAVQAAVAQSGRLKSLTLELGGKNPIIVAPDCDPAVAADAVVRGMNFKRVQGQSCGSTSRLLVHEDLHDEVVDRVVGLVAGIRLGLPEDEATEMGALISEDHRRRVLGYVAGAIEDGAELRFGGGPPSDRPDLDGGAYVVPTILDRVQPQMRIAREEVFGPVLSVLSWRHDQEVIDLANDSEYGLTASIWTQDITRALAMASQIEAGYIWINDVERRYTGVPFGGWKQSGLGTEQGLAQELLTFTRNKSVNIGLRGADTRGR
jgi:acyl-CoA reductase-like NAD-dependent aldehyde dehydrogenase